MPESLNISLLALLRSERRPMGQREIRRRLELREPFVRRLEALEEMGQVEEVEPMVWRALRDEPQPVAVESDPGVFDVEFQEVAA